jgi:hypothetical protein
VLGRTGEPRLHTAHSATSDLKLRYRTRIVAKWLQIQAAEVATSGNHRQLHRQRFDTCASPHQVNMIQFAQSVVEQALGSGRHGSAKVSKQDRGKEFFTLLPDDLLSSVIGLLDVKALLCLQQCDKRLQRLAVSGICSSCRWPLCHLGHPHHPLQSRAGSCIILKAFNCTRKQYNVSIICTTQQRWPQHHYFTQLPGLYCLLATSAPPPNLPVCIACVCLLLLAEQ